jgi:shikimate kinase
LKSSINNIIKRLKNDNEKIKQRPSLTKNKSFIEEVEEVLKKRHPLYEKASDFQINTDNKTIEDITQEIIKILK